MFFCCFFLQQKAGTEQNISFEKCAACCTWPPPQRGSNGKQQPGHCKTFQGVSLLLLCESVCGLLFTLRFIFFFQFPGTVWFSQADKTSLNVLTCVGCCEEDLHKMWWILHCSRGFHINCCKAAQGKNVLSFNKIFKLWTVPARTYTSSKGSYLVHSWQTVVVTVTEPVAQDISRRNMLLNHNDESVEHYLLSSVLFHHLSVSLRFAGNMSWYSNCNGNCH